MKLTAQDFQLWIKIISEDEDSLCAVAAFPETLQEFLDIALQNYAMPGAEVLRLIVQQSSQPCNKGGERRIAASLLLCHVLTGTVAGELAIRYELTFW